MKYIVRYFTSFCQFSSLKSVKYFGICFTKTNLSEQKIEVGLHIEQEINQIQRYLEKELIRFCKQSVKHLRVDGSIQDLTQRARLVQFLLKEILAQRCTYYKTGHRRQF